jgi:hypothetical protein
MTITTLEIGSARYHMRNNFGPLDNLWEEASRRYRAEADKFVCATNNRASDFPVGMIKRDGELIARVSWNGRVWPPEPWTPAQKHLWSPPQVEKEFAENRE